MLRPTRTYEQAKCSEHNNHTDRICLYPNCQDRLLCMLCEHDHVFMPSILQKLSTDKKKFFKKVDEAIDQVLAQTQQYSGKDQLAVKVEKVNRYFQKCVEILKKIVQDSNKRVVDMLTATEDDEVLNILKKYRISGNYHQATSQQFQIFLNLSEGATIEETYRKKSALKAKKADQALKSFQGLFNDTMNILDPVQKRPRMPDLLEYISNPVEELKKQAQQKADAAEDKYIRSDLSRKTQLKKIAQTRIHFDSLLTDVIRQNEVYLACSYDRKLRVVSQALDELRETEPYGNTLEKLHSLTQKQFLMAISKQIHVMSIAQDHTHEIKKLMRLRGHESKIVGLDNLNSRIVGSCAQDCVKVWDLYKQNQHYSIREQGPLQIRFIPQTKRLAVGYSDWSIKYFDVETLKRAKHVKLKGVPICSALYNQNLLYFGGMPSTLTAIDYRSPDLTSIDVGGDALSSLCLVDSYQVLYGNRSGEIGLIDTRKGQKVWGQSAHQSGNSNAMKANGVIRIFWQRARYEDNEVVSSDKIISAGAGQKKIKMWNLV